MPPVIEPLSDPGAVARAAQRVRAGGLVAFPTETVYGLGGDATSDRAVAAIFEAKGRPAFNPLIAHLPDAAAARRLARFTPLGETLAARFWPGPLTLVLDRAESCPVSLLACAGLDSVALRVPGHAGARRFLAAVGRPVAAPSANPSGRLSPTLAAHVADGLGAGLAMILDGGACEAGLESTIVDARGTRPVLLRPGVVTAEMLATAAGPLGPAPDGGTIAAPGMLESHYAPGLPVRLDAICARPGEAFLDFAAACRDRGGARAYFDLSPGGDLGEAAANLFAMLRALDRPDYARIAVAPVPGHGLGAAIRDRLRRAAAPRG